MSKENKEKGNKSMALVDENVMDEVVCDLITTSNDKRRDTFIAYWLFGLSPNKAALKAGYSKSYAQSGVLKALKHSKSLRARIEEFAKIGPERYRQLAQLRLGTIAGIEGAALQEYRANPRLVIDKPQLLKQIKQSSGVLLEEGEKNSLPSNLMLSIGQQHLQAIFNINNSKEEGHE